MKGLKKWQVALMIMGVLIGGLFYAKEAMEKNLEALSQEQMQSFDMLKLEDGVFKGSYSALPVMAKVEVTIQDKVIKDIQLVQHNNGQGADAESILTEVVNRQNVNVEVVSGATNSSMVILKAVEDALIKSAGIQ